jgi:polyisoprenoid-binding protein YceI
VTVTGNASGQPVDVSLPGTLTIHGVTKNVTAAAKAQLTGGKVEVAGSMAIDMSDYGVTPPSVPFTTVDSQVTIEFQIFLSKTA